MSSPLKYPVAGILNNRKLMHESVIRLKNSRVIYLISPVINTLLDALSSEIQAVANIRMLIAVQSTCTVGFTSQNRGNTS